MGLTPVVRDEASAPFFDGTSRGELQIRRCVACGSLQAPDRTQCPRCGGIELEWVRSSGRGRLVSWTVVHTRASRPDDSPRTDVLGLVELDEGPWMHSAILVGEGNDEGLRVGAPLEVDFVRPEQGEALPVFRPA